MTPAQKRKATILKSIMEKYHVDETKAASLYLQQQRIRASSGGRASFGYSFGHGANDPVETGRLGGLAKKRNESKN